MLVASMLIPAITSSFLAVSCLHAIYYMLRVLKDIWRVTILIEESVCLQVPATDVAQPQEEDH